VVVYDTVGTDLEAIRRDYGNSSVEPPTMICRVCLVAKSFVFGQVGHKKDCIVLVLLSMIEGQADGVFADASSLGDGRDTIIDVVTWGVVRLSLQAERLCSFGDNVLIVPIEERDDGALAVQS
jgi:hypothetical protein